MKSNSRPIEDCLMLDHNELRSYYDCYNAAVEYKDKQKFFNQIGWEIARHSVAEEIVVYPVLRERVPDGNILADDSLEDDRKAKKTLSELNSLDPNSVDFAERFKIFMWDIFSHIDKEEKLHIPKLVERIPLEERISLGQKFENRKIIAPTRPHQWTADKYPFLETLEGVLLAPIDKFLDLFKSFPPKETLKNITDQNIKTATTSFSTGNM
jgi:hypothetical protein